MKPTIFLKVTSLALAIAYAGLAFGAEPLQPQSAPQTASQPVVEPGNYLATIPWDAEYDVIVLGYGIAGGTSAISAADKGAKVLLAEKAPEGKEGGNSKYAGQFALWIDPKYPDEVALKYLNRMKGDSTNPSEETYKTFIREAKKQLEFLEFLGVKNPPHSHYSEYPEFEGHEAFGMATVKEPGGNGALYALIQDNVKKRGDNIDIWFNSPGKVLLQDPKSGIIHGVIIEVDGQPKYVRAKNGVVLATGGYENNPDMFRDFARTQKAYPKGARYNTGEGILMAMDVKANIVNMATNNGPDPNVVNPDTGLSYGYMVTGDKDSAWDGPAFTRHNVIMVGGDGKRFWNETQKTRHGRVKFHDDFIPLQMPDRTFMIFDENARQASKVYGSWSEGSVKEIEKGIVKKAETLEELAKLINVDVEGLTSEVARYNEFCKNGKDLDWDRPANLLKPIEKGPFYAIEVLPTYTNTQGGPERDETGAILDRQGKRIPHLYGAGELGSIFPHKYNAAGNIGEGLIFGKIAGAEAATPKTDVTQESVLNGKPGFKPATAVKAFLWKMARKLALDVGLVAMSFLP